MDQHQGPAKNQSPGTHYRKPSKNRPSAFEPNHEYRYDVETRTVSTLTDADQRKYVGIATRAELRLCLAPTDPQHNSTVHLVGQLINRKYAKINNELENWRQDSVKRTYNNVGPQEACEKPFSLVYKKGEIDRMYVDKSCFRNADLNQLKGVMSQFQVNLRKAKEDELNKNAYTANGASSKVFKTTEATISGDCETHYKVSWVPAQFVKPEWYPVPQSPVEEEGARFMRVTKRKNYDNCKRRVGFNFESNGDNDQLESNPLGNNIGDFFRVSLSEKITKFNIFKNGFILL